VALALAPAERTVIVDALGHFDGERYLLGAYVVMDHYVHLVVLPLGDHTLSAMLHRSEPFAAHALQGMNSRDGAVWQHGSHSRVIRDEDALFAMWAYILDKPTRRSYEDGLYVWAGVSELRL